MSDSKSRYKATIDGEKYTIVGPKSQKHMQVVAETVDEQLAQLKEMTKGMSKEKRAVLLAINAVSDQLAMRKELEEIKKKMNDSENEQSE